MLTACYDPVVNGVTQMVAHYDRHLSAAGHKVTIFTLGTPPPNEDRSKVIRSLAVPLGKTGYHFSLRYDRHAQMRLHEVDVLHCHHLLMALEFAGRYGRSPVVFTNHTRYDIYLSAYGRLPYRAASMIMRQAWPRFTGVADAVIAPSASIWRIMRRSGVRRPIELIENGIEVDHFQRPVGRNGRSRLGIPATATVFVYVGRLSREKNVRRLVAEFSTAAGQDDDLHLLLVGAGPMEAKLRKMVGGQHLHGKVHFMGQVEPTKIPAILAIGDAFVSALLSEVHPLAVIEALAAGLPVVAIKSPGVADIVDHDRSGLLVDGSPGSLALAIRELASSGDVRQRLAEEARLAGRRYDIRFTVERTLLVYRRLIEGRYGCRAGPAAKFIDDIQSRKSTADRGLELSAVRGAGGEDIRE